MLRDRSSTGILRCTYHSKLSLDTGAAATICSQRRYRVNPLAAGQHLEPYPTFSGSRTNAAIHHPYMRNRYQQHDAGGRSATPWWREGPALHSDAGRRSGSRRLAASVSTTSRWAKVAPMLPLDMTAMIGKCDLIKSWIVRSSHRLREHIFVMFDKSSNTCSLRRRRSRPTADCVIPRKPLAATARRAGWQGATS